MSACIIFSRIGRHRWLQQGFWAMVRWLGTRYLGGFPDCPMPERDISNTTCQRTCRVSWTWRRSPIKRGAPFGTKETRQCSPWCTSCTKSGAIVSSSGPSSSFEVVANEVVCRYCGYIPHECRNGQCWRDRNAVQIPGFTKSLCIHNDTEIGQDRPQSYTSKWCGNNSEVLGIERAVAEICTSCLAGAQPGTTYMFTEFRSLWLW